MITLFILVLSFIHKLSFRQVKSGLFCKGSASLTISGTSIPVAAYALGARFIEKHFTLDRLQKGTDHQFSLTPTLLKTLVDDLEEIRLAMGDGEKKLLSEEKLARFKMGKKIVFSNYASKGTKIELKDLSFKSPGDGIPPNELSKVLGKVISKDYKIDEALDYKDLES